MFKNKIANYFATFLLCFTITTSGVVGCGAAVTDQEAENIKKSIDNYFVTLEEIFLAQAPELKDKQIFKADGEVTVKPESGYYLVTFPGLIADGKPLTNSFQARLTPASTEGDYEIEFDLPTVNLPDDVKSEVDFEIVTGKNSGYWSGELQNFSQFSIEIPELRLNVNKTGTKRSQILLEGIVFDSETFKNGEKYESKGKFIVETMSGIEKKLDENQNVTEEKTVFVAKSFGYNANMTLTDAKLVSVDLDFYKKLYLPDQFKSVNEVIETVKEMFFGIEYMKGEYSVGEVQVDGDVFYLGDAKFGIVYDQKDKNAVKLQVYYNHNNIDSLMLPTKLLKDVNFDITLDQFPLEEVIGKVVAFADKAEKDQLTYQDEDAFAQDLFMSIAQKSKIILNDISASADDEYGVSLKGEGVYAPQSPNQVVGSSDLVFKDLNQVSQDLMRVNPQAGAGLLILQTIGKQDGSDYSFSIEMKETGEVFINGKTMEEIQQMFVQQQ